MGARIPEGWELAPEAFAQEIFLVWQEDEMPEELKQSPGYTPFTLSPDAQAWVDSMAEVEPFQDGKVQRVIGRPKPLVERPRRQLAGEPSPSPAFQVVSPSPQPPVPPPEPPREPPRAMPDVTAGHTTVRPAPESRDVATDRKRHPRAMPEIGAAADPGATETEEEPRPMPEIGGAHQQETGSAPEKPRPLPEIG